MLTLQYILVAASNVYSIIIVVYVLMSWIPNKSGVLGDIDRFLGKLCDPYLNIFKKFIPPIGGIMDISPIVALIVLQLVVQLIVRVL